MSQNRCIEHTMHLMACHFVKALKIAPLAHAKQQLHAKGKDEIEETEEADLEAGDDEDELDVDTSMEVEASADDVEALREASLTDFEPGDVVGKLMAFVSQLRSCGEDTRDYLKKLADAQGLPQWEIILWIRTRWGSLSDCFRVTLTLQKVRTAVFFYYIDLHLVWLGSRSILFFCRHRGNFTTSRVRKEVG